MKLFCITGHWKPSLPGHNLHRNASWLSVEQMRDELTCLILTYNEEPNIRRTLQQLTWVKRIVVIDSFSTDRTLEVLRSFPQVEVYQHRFESFARQCNYGLEQIDSDWVLSLDADYVLSAELIAELQAIPTGAPLDGFFAPFRYCVNGKPLRGTLYPPRQVLYRRDKARYQDDGHGHRVQVIGRSGTLSGTIWHDDRKPFLRWLTEQDRYMVQEARKLYATPRQELNLADRIRLLKLPAPFLILLYCLVVKRGALDGWAGWYYAFQRMFVELLLALKLIEYTWRQDVDAELAAHAPNPTAPRA